MRRERAAQPDDAAAGVRIGNRHDDAEGPRDARRGQALEAGRVGPQRAQPFPPGRRDALRVDVHERVGHARLLEDARDVRPVQAGAHDDDVARARRLLPFARILDGLGEAHGERRARREEERREDERSDGRGDDRLSRVARQQPERRARRREDERELADVRERERGARRRPRDGARGPERNERGRRLDGHEDENARADLERVGDEKRGIEEHPDGDEEQAREQVVERRERRGDLVNVVALAEDDPGGERAHRGRDAEPSLRPRPSRERGPRPLP